MNLRATLERTGLRASLAPEYTAGRAAAATQLADGRPTAAAASYFGLPAIKPPEWDWYVPAYFFVGGTASGAYIVATVADLLGRRQDRGHILAGRLVAMAGLLLSPPLLVVDLGRPERFLHMLRVFKPRSMMNTGSWALTGFGLFGGLAALVEVLLWLGHRRPWLRLLAAGLRPLTWLGLLPACYVGTYTGLLLSATNVPLWAANRRFLGALFLSSAMSSGLAATSLVARLVAPRRHGRTSRRLARAERTVLLTELALTLASAIEVRAFARPLLGSAWLRCYLVGSLGAGMLAPLALGDRAGAWPVARSVLVLLGALVTRFAWTAAGKASAQDPHAYFAYTGSSHQHPGAGDAAPRRRHGATPRVELPTHGRLRGTITLSQEDRFRLEDAQGRGYLLTLGRGLGVGLPQLRQWGARQAQVEVEYTGAPDLGAVAVSMREVGA